MKQSNHIKPKKRDIYATHHGDYAGQMFIACHITKSEYGFLAIPDMENVTVPKEKFDFGMDNGILEFVEQMPIHMFSTVKKQYKKNKKNEEV
jgi:hypothetical protein